MCRKTNRSVSQQRRIDSDSFSGMPVRAQPRPWHLLMWTDPGDSLASHELEAALSEALDAVAEGRDTLSRSAWTQGSIDFLLKKKREGEREEGAFFKLRSLKAGIHTWTKNGKAAGGYAFFFCRTDRTQFSRMKVAKWDSSCVVVRFCTFLSFKDW